MQPNAFEQFQNQAALKESQRFLGFRSHSQIRAFLEGRPVAPSGVLDQFVWLIGGGYENILIGGPIPEALVNRQERPSTSLEKFFSEYLQYFFKKDYKRSLIEQLYVKFTNQMDAEDVKIVYEATSGEIDVDADQLERYAGNRRFPNGVPIFQRSVYDRLKASAAVQKQEDPEPVKAPAIVAQTPASDPVAPPAAQTSTGPITEFDPLDLQEDEDEDDTVDPVVAPPADDSGKTPRKPKAKVDEPKKERKVRVPRDKKPKE